MPVALITGASRGLGQALAAELAAREWSLVLDGRDATALSTAAARLPSGSPVTTIPGDVADAAHRQELAAAVASHGHLDLLVNNASHLGPSPMPALGELAEDELARILAVNLLAPHALTRALLPALAPDGTVVNVTSDAAVEPYPGWGGYGASKAALEQLTAILGAEQPGLAVYAVDPGDMRTAMHQAAFPDEDISDRPEPTSVVPALLALLEHRPPSGRYRAQELLAGAGGRG